MKKVSIILVHYNTDEFTTECLRSLENVDQSGCSISIVVVDNASKHPFTYDSKNLQLHLIRNEENTGFTGGNNVGIEYAFEHYKPDYILLLNTDTLIDPNFLIELIKIAEAHQDVGSVSPKIYFQKGYEFHKNSYSDEEKGKIIWFAGGSIDWKDMYAFHRGVDELDRGQFELKPLDRSNEEMPFYDYQKMDFASGCCVLFPTEVLKKVGLFDESYFAYWEDVDLSVRVAQAGLKHYFAPKAVVWHKNAGSSGGSGSVFQQRLQKKNRLKFALKYASLKTKLSVLKQHFLT